MGGGKMLPFRKVVRSRSRSVKRCQYSYSGPRRRVGPGVQLGLSRAWERDRVPSFTHDPRFASRGAQNTDPGLCPSRSFVPSNPWYAG